MSLLEGFERYPHRALEAGPLDNIANNASPRVDSGSRRALRYARREVLWKVSSLRRLWHCGRTVQHSADGVGLRVREGVAGLAGLQHCGSVWSCPVCSGRILLHRALEIGSVLGAAVAEGHSLAFGTFTMRHHAAQPLGALWGSARVGWRRVTSGKGWQLNKARIVGMVRVWEVTTGRNGWHVHVHFVLVLEPGVTDLDSIVRPMFQRWSAGLQSEGLEAPQLVGQDWQLVNGEKAAEALGEYLAKIADAGLDAPAHDVGLGLGLELTHTMPGRSAAGLKTAPVWALLDQFVRTGDAEMLGKWQEWEQVSKGKQQIGWSRGLRERFAPSVEELTDDEIVAEEIGTEDDEILRMDAAAWRDLVSTPGRCLELLEASERSPKYAMVLLDEWGIKYKVSKGYRS